MKKFVSYIILGLISLSSLPSADAAGYTEALYLCDLGIKNSNSLNQQGVDFVQYSQMGRNLNVSAGTEFTSALSMATQANSSFDRWDENTGLDNVSINLESELYGVEYYLEYCYKWDRIMPSDNINYDVTFFTNLPNAVAHTIPNIVTNCSIKANNGNIIDTPVSSSFVSTNTITTDSTSMRCTIRINFKEDSFFTARPHNGGLVGVDPNITVKVRP